MKSLLYLSFLLVLIQIISCQKESKDMSITAENEVVNPQYLTISKAKIDSLEIGLNTKLKIGILGDSNMQAKHRVSEPFRDILSDLGDGGGGYIAFSNKSENPSWAINTHPNYSVGTSNFIMEDFDRGTPVGLDGTSIFGTGNISFTEDTTKAGSQNSEYVVLYEQNPSSGNIRQRVNGGIWSDFIGTTGANSIQSFTIPISNPTAANVIEIEITGSDTRILGAIGRNNNSGVEFSKLGNSGATSVQFALLDQALFEQQLNIWNADLVYVLLGTNDKAQSISTAIYTQSIIKLVDRIQIELPNCEIILVEPANDNLKGHICDYGDKLRTIANSKQCGFISLRTHHVNYEVSNSLGNFSDDVHFTPKGGIMNAEYFFFAIN